MAGKRDSDSTSVSTMISAIKALLPGVEDDDIMSLELLVQRAQDPVVLATLIAALIEERRRTNALLKEIRDALAALQTPPSSAPAPPEDLGLSERDEQILALVRERGMVCAEDIRDALGYKGLNAASARLNFLYRQGLVRKIRKGRKVYYAPA
ncbi:MAG: hypothetical protein GXN93_04520 [Candidatus Diapherotrites archaeon]|nr:hypothetical protein [Candidatus Diapherotrites archaeon]